MPVIAHVVEGDHVVLADGLLHFEVPLVILGILECIFHGAEGWHRESQRDAGL